MALTEWQQRIGVGQTSHAFPRHGKAPRRRDVITEEGALRGTVGGYHLDHHDGRVDANVFAPTVTQKTSVEETR